MPYEGYEYYYGRELVIAIPAQSVMRIEVEYNATDTQAVEIKDLYRPDQNLARLCSGDEEDTTASHSFELENAEPKERKLIVIGGSKNGRKWWLSTPIVRWKNDGLIIGFSDRHERAMNDASDRYANTVATITFEALPTDSAT